MLNIQRLFSEKGNCSSSVVFLLRRGVQQTAGSVQLSQVWCDWHPLQRRLVAACRNVIIICRSELGSFNCLNTLLLVFSIIQSRILSPQIELYRLMAAVWPSFNQSVASLNIRLVVVLSWHFEHRASSSRAHTNVHDHQMQSEIWPRNLRSNFLSACILITHFSFESEEEEKRRRRRRGRDLCSWALWDASQEASCESETVMMEEREVRVVVVGDQRCGKSALISRCWIWWDFTQTRNWFGRIEGLKLSLDLTIQILAKMRYNIVTEFPRFICDKVPSSYTPTGFDKFPCTVQLNPHLRVLYTGTNNLLVKSQTLKRCNYISFLQIFSVGHFRQHQLWLCPSSFLLRGGKDILFTHFKNQRKILTFCLCYDGLQTDLKTCRRTSSLCASALPSLSPFTMSEVTGLSR